MPVAVACGAAGAGAGAGAVSGADVDSDAEEDGDPCGVTPSGEEPPVEACIGVSCYVGSLASKSNALVQSCTSCIISSREV